LKSALEFGGMMRATALRLTLAPLTAVALAAAAIGAQVTSTQPALAPATLAGVIRDSTGAAILDAEVFLRGMNRNTRTNAQGQFTLADVPPETYEVWFRRLGYESAQYTWSARSGERTEVAVTLHMLPRSLDPVVIRAREEKTLKGNSALLGIVIDSLGQAVEEAEVQLVGADRTAATLVNGGFLFRSLPVGPYVVRVRKLGYAPNVLHFELQDGEEREVIIRIRALAQGLDPVVVNEQSGYGKDQAAWDDLDKRRRWHTSKEIVMGRDELRRYYSYPLDLATQFMRGGTVAAPTRSVTDALAPARGGTGRDPRRDAARERREIQAGAPEGDACILLNGGEPMRRPLRSFAADELELLEIYPPWTELSGTVKSRFEGMNGCRPDQHPTYYVLWMK
jgi:hypothetical protein